MNDSSCLQRIELPLKAFRTLITLLQAFVCHLNDLGTRVVLALAMPILSGLLFFILRIGVKFSASWQATSLPSRDSEHEVHTDFWPERRRGCFLQCRTDSLLPCRGFSINGRIECCFIVDFMVKKSSTITKG